MMRPDDVKTWLQKRPFQPFAIQLTSGERHEIRHPENLWVGPSTCLLGLFRDELLNDFVQIALLHIVKIEPLEYVGASGPSKN